MELIHQKAKPRSWALAQGYTPPETQHLWESLHLALPMWEASGKFCEDISGLGLHADTWGSGVVWSRGELGPCLDMSGTGCWVRIADPPANWLDGCAAFTAELWFEIDALTATHGLIGKYRATDGYRSWRIYVLSDGNIEMQVSANGIAFETKRTTTAPITTGTLYHLLVTYNAGAWACYVNGVSQATQGSYTITSIYGGTDYVQIGKRFDSVYFDGRVYSARFWQRALGAEEIGLLYEQPFRQYEPSPDEPSWAVLHSGAQAAGPWELVAEVDAGVEEFYIQSLVNGVSYDVYAKTVDLSGNESAGCAFQAATPVAGGAAWAGLHRGITVAPVRPLIQRRYR